MDKNLQTIPGSIAKLTAEAKADKLETLVVLIDRSGSMSAMFDANQPKIQAAQDAMDKLWETTSWDICEMYVKAFDDYTEDVACDEYNKAIIPQPRGGTDFTTALQNALDQSDTPTRIILCSDGQAAYPSDQIAICSEQAIPIDTIFISYHHAFDQIEPGEELLRRISEETGGQFCTVEDAESLVAVFAQLETSQRLLLDYQPEESNVIKL